jgi:L-asparaginase/Glu-tRNA(Gln) amidotransferase subunit D
MRRPKILIVSPGGTITMMRDATGAITPTLSATDLVNAIPQMDSVADIEAISLMRIPGASLSVDNLLELVALIDHSAANGIDGVVVVQGTDTIEETAFTLDLLLKTEAPVVITGAMRGPSRSRISGAVLAGMGAGHVPECVIAPVRELVQTMPVILATGVHSGPVFLNTYGFPRSEKDLLSAGVQSAAFLGPLKARLLLM